MAQKRPTAKVSNLSKPTLKSNKIKATWKNGKSARSGNAAYSSISTSTLLNGVNTTSGKKTLKNDRTINKATTNNATSIEVALNRKLWYPYAGKPKLGSIVVTVWGKNGKGPGPKQKSPALAISVPATPTLTLELDEATGTLTAQSVSKAVDGANERHDQVLSITRAQNYGDQADLASSLYDNTSTAETLSESVDVADAKGLTQDQWIKVTATSYARGLGGDSAVATRSHVFAWPATPEITGVACANAASQAGMVIVGVKTNHDAATHPVDQVQLQRLASSSATTPESAAVQSGWTDVDGATDNGSCTGLTDQLADAYPADGTRTWYRIKATHDDYTVYGLPVQLDIYNTVSSGSVTVGTVDILGTSRSGEDGTSIELELGWDGETGTAIEVSRSTDPRAWRSDSPPTTFDFDWEDDEPRDQEHDHTAAVTLTGLETGKTVYVRARRYIGGDSPSYGAYGDIVAITPVESPGSVQISAPATVERGSSFTASWSHSGSSPQSAWALTDEVSGRTWSGDGAAGALTLSAEDIGDADSMTLFASVTTGSGNVWSHSEAQRVAIADPPSCEVAMPATIEAQGTALSVSTDAKLPRLHVALVAGGVTHETPVGTVAQAEGDVVAEAEPFVEWDESGGLKVATVRLPDSDEIHDGGVYTLRATVTDEATGLSSPVATASATVAWSHQAVAPTATITTDPDELSATIVVEAPYTYEAGDVCDLYRLTSAKAVPIATGLPFGAEVTDVLAPYSSVWRDTELAYRVATRTADGDLDWDDVPYELAGEDVTLDWDGHRLGLPYDHGFDGGYEKGFEARSHPLTLSAESGGVRPEGFWDPVVQHRATITTDLHRSREHERRELLDQVSGYPGPVFVRLPNGEAYEADVQLSNVRESYDGTPVAATLSVTEIALTDEHRPSRGLSEIVDPAWGGGALIVSRGIVYDGTGRYPLPDWDWLGWSETLEQGYVTDGAQAVRSLDGDAMVGWSYDGVTLTDENDEAVELTEEVPDGD